MLILYIVVFIISCLLLFKSGAWTVKYLSKIATFLGFSEFFMAFILMAVATSLPEFFVGLSSAIRRQPNLSLGNVLGANIINLTLVIFIGLLVVKKIPFKKEIVRRDFVAAALVGVLSLILMIDAWLSRFDGFVLLLVFCFSVIDLYKRQQNGKRFIFNGNKRDLWQKLSNFFKNFLLFVFSIGLLLASAYGVTRSGAEIALGFGLPLVLIGILIIALGTTLPEIVFGFRVMKLGKQEMLLGNTLGSVVTNSTLVLGTAALIYPIQILAPRPIIISAIFFLATLIFFGIFSRTRFTLSRREGIVLLLIYLAFLATQLVFTV